MQETSGVRRTVLEDVLFVESRVVRGRVKRKHVALEIERPVDSPRESSARGTVRLRVGKELIYTLDPAAVLVTSSEERCGQFREVKPGLFSGAPQGSLADLELYYLELSTSDESWGQGAQQVHGMSVVRICFESRSALDRWHGVLQNELYQGNSIHKTLSTSVGQDDDAEAAASMWESFLHINGISVYTQKEQMRRGSGSEGCSLKNDTGMMSSVVIRDSPRVCLGLLLQESLSFDSSRDSRIGGTLAFSDSLEVIQRVDRYSSLVRMRWSCSSADMIIPCIMWPRESILLRTWRKSDDGTYVVVYQPANAMKKYGVSRDCVEADAVFGFTIAPLREEYFCASSKNSGNSMRSGKATKSRTSPKSPKPGDREPGHGVQGRGEQQLKSPESLVTLVINADVGGIAASNNLLSKISPVLHKKLVIALLKPLVMSLVLMRDRLEQSRFVVMPSMFSQEEEGLGEDEDDWIDLSESSASIKPARVESGLIRAGTGVEGALTGRLSRRSIHAPSTPTTPTVYGQYGSTDTKFWSYPGFDYLKIRGKTYLEDRVKVRADSPVFELYSSDLVNSERVMLNIAKDLPSIQYCDAPYAFVLNLVFPNKPLQNLVTTWTCPVDPTQHTVEELVAMDCFAELERLGGPSKSGTLGSSTSSADSSIPTRSAPADNASLRAFFKTFKEWVQGDQTVDDERRNKKFKLIPRIARGSWVIKQAVGTTPVLLGQKLQTRYFRGRTARGCNYFEVDVDITSNPVANNITRLVVNSITSLVVDLAPLIEGQDVDDLPERLIGSVRYNHLDLTCGSAFADGGRGGLEPVNN